MESLNEILDRESIKKEIKEIILHFKENCKNIHFKK
jgi:hypothetical protein